MIAHKIVTMAKRAQADDRPVPGEPASAEQRDDQPAFTEAEFVALAMQLSADNPRL